MTNQSLLKVVVKASELGDIDPSALVKESSVISYVVREGSFVAAYIDKSELVKWCALVTGREPTEEMLEIIASYLFSGNTSSAG